MILASSQSLAGSFLEETWHLGGMAPEIPIKRTHITRRIIPVSNWLGSPPFISHLAYLEGEYPYLGDLLTMVINHLLNGMILQVGLGMEHMELILRVPSHSFPETKQRVCP